MSDINNSLSWNTKQICKIVWTKETLIIHCKKLCKYGSHKASLCDAHYNNSDYSETGLSFNLSLTFCPFKILQKIDKK